MLEPWPQWKINEKHIGFYTEEHASRLIKAAADLGREFATGPAPDSMPGYLAVFSDGQGDCSAVHRLARGEL